MYASDTVHRTLNIAHRGARSLAPENTLAAAGKALEIGADMWELDVGMTADGELIVLHDATLSRTSNAAVIYPDREPWQVQDFTLDELRRLDFGSWFIEKDPFGQIADGNVSNAERENYVGERLLTLAEALQFTLRHGWYVNVEIKDLRGTKGDAQVVERTVQMIEQLRAVGHVVISSFNPTYLERANRAIPDVSTGLLVKSHESNPISLLKRLRAKAYHPRLQDLNFLDFESLQAHGFEVRVWVVNDEKTMRALLEMGVNGIFTDFPGRLKSLQNASGASYALEG